ncbi:DUF1876 family protein [Micromonospora sp. WMMD1102]|uniref:dsRBD fold-containing protein n=1 Tax=Micromonospora sp. WMMD1102 TaxID=3016105 RepID=UPI0024158C9C|nr:dsRBD fold-containing protein [Micromonospora sp. WMMD1102]MDG4786694.1 DUF1876 family protein [Micromonospora sp. WMMD1102]
MARAERWTVDIVIEECDDERRTRAEARLQTPQRIGLVGYGVAWRNPADRRVPEIGDELAVSRALADLAHGLLLAADDTGRTARARRLRAAAGGAR